MASGITPWKLPGSVVSGSGWTNPNNVLLTDAVIAQANMSKNTTSSTLQVAFNFASEVPPEAFITGIEFQSNRYASGGGLYENNLTIVVGSQTSQNKATSTTWATAMRLDSRGGSADNWGLLLDGSMLAMVLLNIAARVGLTARNAMIDDLQLRLHWTTDRVVQSVQAGLTLGASIQAFTPAQKIRHTNWF